MTRGAVCLLVLGLTNILNAAELGLEGVSTSELKEIEQEIAKGNVPPNFNASDKLKRGVAKLTNTDNPSFNHLSSGSSSKINSANAAAAAAAAAAAGIGATAGQQAPLRYVYSNQYYPSNPYLSYIQPQHQAAQIAAQYAFQPSGVTHYLQTPTQIQYVSSPSIAQVPSAKYQALNSKLPNTNVGVSGSVSVNSASAAAAAAAAASQYVSPQPLLLTSPQTFIPQHYVTQPSTSSSSSAQPGSTASAMSAYQQQQPLYYPQQPIVMLLVNPQPNPMAYLYPNHQQHQMAYLLGQHQLLNLFGGHRFGLPYSQAQANQVTYLVPMAVPTAQQQTVGTTATAANTVEKTASSIAQEQASSSSFGLRTNKS